MSLENELREAADRIAQLEGKLEQKSAEAKAAARGLLATYAVPCGVALVAGIVIGLMF